jgi:hypothetical protein
MQEERYNCRKRAISEVQHLSEHCLLQQDEKNPCPVNGSCKGSNNPSSVSSQLDERLVASCTQGDPLYYCRAQLESESNVTSKSFHDMNESTSFDINQLFPDLSQIPDFGPVAYLRSERHNELDPRIERNGNRAMLVDSLIDALGVAKHFEVVEVIAAKRQQLLHFHTSDYVSALESPHRLSSLELEEFGLVDDCPVIDDLFELVSLGQWRGFV